MKKLFSGFVLMLVLLWGFSLASAQVWYPPPVTMAWTAVTMLDDGAPIPTGYSVKYQGYTKTPLDSTPVQVGQPVETTEVLIAFQIPGRYFLGVKALMFTGTTLTLESIISWSDDPVVCKDNISFGVVYGITLKQPFNLKKK